MIRPDPADKAKHELLQCYRRGFKNGASCNARDRRFTEHSRQDIVRAYLRGYEHGQAASISYAAEECERLQYDPRFSVLRIAAPTEPPTTQHQSNAGNAEQEKKT